MSDKTPLRPDLYKDRPVEETISVYDKWAATYDADLSARGYHTPKRIAEALSRFVGPDTTVLDFGCGTGVSGLALRAQGFVHLHGTDVTQAMLDQAAAKEVYEKLWLSDVMTPPAAPGAYQCVVAVGVISLAAAPPETLHVVLDMLATGGICAISFNDPSIAAGTYDAVLAAAVAAGQAEILLREHGPHIDEMNMGCDVIVLRRL